VVSVSFRAGRASAAFAFGVLSSCAQPDDYVARPDVPEPTCDTGCGLTGCPCPEGNHVPITVGTASFAIDATEVTVTQYSRFLEVRGVVPERRAGDRCSFNESYQPVVGSLNVDDNCVLGFDYERILDEEPERPVVCVDVCDARDYCAWVHGRLCGATKGELATSSQGTSADEWFLACSGTAGSAYCYGATFSREACNVGGSGHGEIAIPVGSLPTCEGPVPGLFDLNGNANEWIGACDASSESPTLDPCYRVGGAFFQDDPASSRCDSGSLAYRSTLGNDNGFRCCYD
jgi:formylglycine-generating enzyme required for sulfatase activity